MMKLCDSCARYAKDAQFCFVRCMKIGRNLVDYCKDYVPRKGENGGRKA